MSEKHLLADEGVSSVARVFQKELRWVFREQPKADCGIDAHVEVCNNAEPTGQLVALQIKSGQSFFRECNDLGFVFRFSDRHRRYWLHHCLPVIVVLYSPVDELIFWERIGTDTVKPARSGWKVTVPYENLLRHQSGLDITQAAIAVTGAYEKIDQHEYFRDVGITHAAKVIAPLINCIRNTRVEILVCAPFIDPRFLGILNVVSYSARVKLITRDDLPDHTKDAICYHKHRSGNFSVKRNASVHGRFAVIDKKFAFTSSMNFMRASFERTFDPSELVYPTTDKDRVSHLLASFESIWCVSDA